MEQYESTGFHKVFPDEMDKDYFYWQRDFHAHPFLKGLHITVAEKINIYCKDFDNASEAIIFSGIKSDKNLSICLDLCDVKERSGRLILNKNYTHENRK